jgi:hypothetical protein
MARVEVFVGDDDMAKQYIVQEPQHERFRLVKTCDLAGAAVYISAPKHSTRASENTQGVLCILSSMHVRTHMHTLLHARAHVHTLTKSRSQDSYSSVTDA